MNRCARLATATAIAVASFALILARGFSPSSRADDTGTQTIPAPLAPLEYLLGRWNGRGVFKDSTAKRFRGWDEKHSWAWIFVKGEPVGLSVTIEGGKVLAAGKLTFDPVRKLYRLEGTEPKPGGPIVLEGTIDKSSKHLVLDRVDLAGNSAKDGPKMRLSLWTNANSLRYTMAEEVRERGAYQYSKVLEVGSTREGESLAPSGDSASSGPKCIVTGGAASMTLSYQGRTYPICCTGCRDAFNDDPEKYLKKASLMLGSQSGKAKTGQPASTRVGRFDDAFANDVVDTNSSDTALGARARASPAETSKKAEKSKEMPDATAAEAEDAKQAGSQERHRLRPLGRHEEGRAGIHAAQARTEPGKSGQHDRGARLFPPDRQGLCRHSGSQDGGGEDQGARITGVDGTANDDRDRCPADRPSRIVGIRPTIDQLDLLRPSTDASAGPDSFAAAAQPALPWARSGYPARSAVVQISQSLRSQPRMMPEASSRSNICST